MLSLLIAVSATQSVQEGATSNVEEKICPKIERQASVKTADFSKFLSLTAEPQSKSILYRLKTVIDGKKIHDIEVDDYKNFKIYDIECKASLSDPCFKYAAANHEIYYFQVEKRGAQILKFNPNTECLSEVVKSLLPNPEIHTGLRGKEIGLLTISIVSLILAAAALGVYFWYKKRNDTVIVSN
jgi:hypothetical protein